MHDDCLDVISSSELIDEPPRKGHPLMRDLPRARRKFQASTSTRRAAIRSRA
jgi:hypothetical protein